MGARRSGSRAPVVSSTWTASLAAPHHRYRRYHATRGYASSSDIESESRVDLDATVVTPVTVCQWPV